MGLFWLCGLACLAWVGLGLKHHGHRGPIIRTDQASGPLAFWGVTALGLALGAGLAVVGLAEGVSFGGRLLGLAVATLALVIPALPTPRLVARAAPRRSSPTASSLLITALDRLAHDLGGSVVRSGVVGAQVDVQVFLSGTLVARALASTTERVHLTLLAGDPGAGFGLGVTAWRERASQPLAPELDGLVAGREHVVERLFERPGAQRLELGPGLARLELELDLGQLRAWVRARSLAPTTAGDGAIVAAHLRAILEQLEALTRPVAPELSLTAIQGAATCPWCKEDLPADLVPALRCGGCGTAHHAACLEEAGGCTVLGCRARAARVRE